MDQIPDTVRLLTGLIAVVPSVVAGAGAVVASSRLPLTAPLLAALLAAVSA